MSKMIRFLILSGALVLGISQANAQQLMRSGAGATAAAMGGASAMLDDSWSAANNIAGLAALEQHTVHTTYENRFGLAEFSTFAFGGGILTPYGNIGLNLMQFGGQLYSEGTLSLGFAREISNVRLGLRTNLMQYRFEGLESKQVITFDFGVQNQLREDLWLGAFVTNVFRAQLYDFEDERTPTVIRLGLSYRPIEKLILNVEADKDVDYDPRMRVGVSYQLVEALAFRTGIVTGEGFQGSFGLGIQHEGFGLDYALTTHPHLNLIHQVSLRYRLPKANKPKEQEEGSLF